MSTEKAIHPKLYLCEWFYLAEYPQKNGCEGCYFYHPRWTNQCDAYNKNTGEPYAPCSENGRKWILRYWGDARRDLFFLSNLPKFRSIFELLIICVRAITENTLKSNHYVS